ncbi:MAG: sulfite exporter TauE/SafE family protein [bacterium]
MQIIVLVFCGLFSGFASGLLGIGGGVLLVPLFYYLLGITMYKAVGTSIALIAVTTIAGSFVHAYNHFIDYRIFLISLAFVISGSILGGFALKYVNAEIIRKIFAVILFLVSLRMFFGGRGL